MNDKTFFGLTATQLNLAFFAVIAALAIGGVVAAAGPSKVLDEAKEVVGFDKPRAEYVVRPMNHKTQTANVPTPVPATPAPVVEAAPEPPCTTILHTAVYWECAALTTTDINVRRGPSVASARIDTKKAGELVSLGGGPVQADGYVWWRLNYGDEAGNMYWIADGGGWLVPTPVCGPTVEGHNQYFDASQGRCIPQNGSGDFGVDNDEYCASIGQYPGPDSKHCLSGSEFCAVYGFDDFDPTLDRCLSPKEPVQTPGGGFEWDDSACFDLGFAPVQTPPQPTPVQTPDGCYDLPAVGFEVTR